MTAFAQTKVGTTAATFLQMPIGTKASGMGGAFVATADDATALFWNPGGISRLARSEFSVSYSEWLAETNYSWAGLVFKLSPDDAIGVSVNQVDYGEGDVTTAAQPEGTGEKWSASSIAVGLTYTRSLTDRFSVGGTLKYVSETVYNSSASALAVDIGLLFKTQLDGLRLGMNISNFGTEMQLSGKDLLQPIDIDQSNTGNNANITGNLATDAWPLPLNFVVGLAYDPVYNETFKVTLAADANYPNNQTSYINAGAEVVWNNLLALRVGYNSIFKDNPITGLMGGVGINYDLGGMNAKIEYSYSQIETFSKDINRISVAVGF